MLVKNFLGTAYGVTSLALIAQGSRDGLPQGLQEIRDTLADPLSDKKIKGTSVIAAIQQAEAASTDEGEIHAVLTLLHSCQMRMSEPEKSAAAAM
eukprot:1858165-Amphidinium_carterae.1